MGAGKTTLGIELSKELGIPFIDTDQEIEILTGKKIEKIFEEEGEDTFRLMEKQVINILSTIEKDYILSVGGGLPCYNQLMSELNSLGTTIYLKHSPETLAKRLINDRSKRPLIKDLSESELLDYIKSKLEQREMYYNDSEVILEENHSAEAILRHLPRQKS
jgi:shikimate kinase